MLGRIEVENETKLLKTLPDITPSLVKVQSKLVVVAVLGMLKLQLPYLLIVADEDMSGVLKAAFADTLG